MDINLVLALLTSIFSLLSILATMCLPLAVILFVVYMYKRIRKDFD